MMAELWVRFTPALEPVIVLLVVPVMVLVAPVIVLVDVPALPMVLFELAPLPNVLVVLAAVAMVALPVDDMAPFTCRDCWATVLVGLPIVVSVPAAVVVLMFVVPEILLAVALTSMLLLPLLMVADVLST